MRRLMYGLAIATALTFAAVSGARVYAQAAKPPDSVVLKGAPMGGVKLDHLKHTKEYGTQCVDCHHASKPAGSGADPPETAMLWASLATAWLTGCRGWALMIGSPELVAWATWDDVGSQDGG